MPDESVDRLDSPARHDLRDVGELEIGLIIALRRDEMAEIYLILIEGLDAI